MNAETRFLTSAEVAILTGRKVRRLQCEALRAMGIPFVINAIGRPVVTAAAIEGRKEKAANSPAKWQPGCLKKAA